MTDDPKTYRCRAGTETQRGGHLVGETFPGSIVRHGTDSGRRRHQRLGERPCEPCRAARTQRETQRKDERGSRRLYMLPGVPLSERVARRVRLTPAGCLEWTGGVTSQGYGLLTFQGAKLYAHRVAYEIARGAIPGDLQIDHLCRNRRCCNPEHLEPVTSAENTRRGFAARRALKRGKSA